MAKMKLEFDGFENVVNRLKQLDGDVKAATETALKDTHKIVTENAEIAIRKHRMTGRTEQSLVRKATVKWKGTVAEVETGFDIKKGGLPSIFLMYGTPRVKKDQKLYNAFFGTATKKEVKKAQESAFYDAIRHLGG